MTKNRNVPNFLMVPWPIALLTLFYGVIAAAASATVWSILSGRAQAILIWPLAWLALSGGAMCGLPLLRPWARKLAIAVSAALTAVTLAFAGLLVVSRQPLGALAATCSATAHLIVIRYLRRSTVKSWFGEAKSIGTQSRA